MEKQTAVSYQSMPIINFNVAGIDVGSKFHVVAVVENAQSNVKSFGVCTEELFSLAHFLKEHGVEKVAMEATGGYERPLLTVLQECGFEVLITDGANTKNYRRFKTDVSDALHIRTLHSLGLLPPIFITEDFSTKIRSLVRLRRTLIEDSANYIRRIQKALRSINVRIDVALADTHSVSGMKILKAMCEGEENPEKLAQLAHGTCHKKPAEIAALLKGNWNDSIRFELKTCYRIFEKIQEEITLLDKQLDNSFKEYTKTFPKTETISIQTKIDKNSPKMPIETYAYQLFGVNLNEIPCFGRDAMLNFIAEVGQEIKAFHSAKAFAKWLGFTPNNMYYVLKRNGLNKLPKNQRKRSIVPFKRYEKQVPGHRIQVDVKFLSFKDPAGKLKKMYQYTAIDDATRARALQIFPKHNQASAIQFIDYVRERFPFRIHTVQTDNGHEFQAKFQRSAVAVVL